MRGFRVPVVAGAILNFAWFPPLPAQESPYPATGARVRVTLSPPALRRSVVGTLVRFDRDSVVVRAADSEPLAYATSAVGRLEVSRGRHGHAVLGAVVGGIGGAAIGLGLFAAACGEGCVGATALGIIPIGTALAGAGIGVGIGSLVRSEQWERAAVPTVAWMRPRRGGGIRLSFAVPVWWRRAVARSRDTAHDPGNGATPVDVRVSDCHQRSAYGARELHYPNSVLARGGGRDPVGLPAGRR